MESSKLQALEYYRPRTESWLRSYRFCALGKVTFSEPGTLEINKIRVPVSWCTCESYVK